ncbi:MAG: exodeoxyribonuclease VII small subunit [Candidatus Brocadiia bacterium]
MGKRLSFEKSLEALERIVEELESGQLTLDEALERYEQGVKAHQQCREILAAAEKRIEELVRSDDGSFHTAPMADAEEEDEA